MIINSIARNIQVSSVNNQTMSFIKPDALKTFLQKEKLTSYESTPGDLDRVHIKD